MNPYSFTVSLLIDLPFFESDVFIKKMGFQPCRQWKAGDNNFKDKMSQIPEDKGKVKEQSKGMEL